MHKGNFMQITGGFLNSRKIITSKSKDVRPTLSKTRQGIFNSLAALIDFNGKSFLDMFAGSGIMTFEAISRGFSDVCTVEKDRKTAQIIKENFINFNLKSDIIIGDSVKVLKKLDKSFDVIFIDPPYDSDLYEQSLSLIAGSTLLKDEGIILLEHSVLKSFSTKGFSVVKIKDYSDIRITFLTKGNIN